MTAKITKDMLIGEVMRRHPETRKVFIKHFGAGCFTCPGAENENIYFGSTIHNVEMAAVLQELNEVVVLEKNKRK
ncbi:MAG: DUF1858 domain-containing protein [Thermodesulfobacteriota bacterium]